uniref:Retinoblastoma-associated protein n=1 Tax=Anthurium amnicola TaxID=1678845 RepID=A0A1D1ZIH2_9ARAE
MKASVKLRDDPQAPPLLRAKLPVAVLGLPFVASASAGDPHDLSFQLRTAFPAGPSLHLAYHPNPHLPHHPFSLTLRSGVGLWGSPDRSPLLLSAHLPLVTSPTPALSFSIQIGPSLGDFSLKRVAASVPPNPNPVPKENGGAVHRPLPVWTEELGAARRDAAEELISGTAVTVRTTLPVTRRAVLRLRWVVNLPAPGGRSAIGGKSLPFLAVDKISIESLREGEGPAAEDERGVVRATKEERDAEALKGMLFWMRREVEELQREQGSIRECLEELRRKAPAAAGAERSGAITPGSSRLASRAV